MNPKTKNILKYTLSFALAIVLVAFAFRGVDWAAFMSGLRETRWFWILMFVAASIGALVFRTIRWQMLLRVFEPEEKAIDVWDALNVGNLINVVLPGAGELVRCGYVSKGSGSYEKSFGTILMERVWDIAAIVVLFVLALSLSWKRFGTFFSENIWSPVASGVDFSIWWIVLIAVAVIVAACWAVWHFRTRSKLCAKLTDSVVSLLQGFASVARMDHKFAFVLCTVGVWTMYILMSWFGLKALPVLSDLTFVDAVFISAVGNIASVIPVPGGIGAYHYLVALTLSSLYSASWDTGILYATLCHETHAILIIVLGVISYFAYSVRKGRRNS